MEPFQCLGCKTYFQAAEKLPLEGLLIEFKNFPFPIKENRHKWTLLKTIASFLNSKGGTIYIGVQDNTGEVIGTPITRKQQDQFKLALKQLLERITPKVDLQDQQEVEVQYVPVVKNKKFQCRYVVKIIVKQGDPSKIYCFTQKIQLYNEQNRDKLDQYQIVYAYNRHNMGGIQQLKGLRLIQSAQKKAIKPNNTAKTFHQDCNPTPLTLEVEITRIAFGNISEKAVREKLQNMFRGQLSTMDLNYNLTNDVDNKVITIDFNTSQEYQKANAFIFQNLRTLNGQDSSFEFVNKGVLLDYYLYENIKGSDRRSQKSRSSSRNQYSPLKSASLLQQRDSEATNASKKQNKKQSKPKNKDGGYYVTFTHINPKMAKALLDNLKSIGKKARTQKFLQTTYVNTIDLLFQKIEDQFKFYIQCVDCDKQLQKFGFNGQLRYGAPISSLRIANYNNNMRKQLFNFIQNLVGQQAKNIEYTKENNRSSLVVKMYKKASASKWLDLLLTNQQLKKFKISGSQKGHAAKMKVYLDTVPIGK